MAVVHDRCACRPRPKIDQPVLVNCVDLGKGHGCMQPAENRNEVVDFRESVDVINAPRRNSTMILDHQFELRGPEPRPIG